jgi:hypothetical protein
MHPYLTRLGIRPEVQSLFRPFFSSDALGNLIFPYGNETEGFGFAFHRIPTTGGLWLAGNLHFAQVRRAIVSASALDAISWLNKKHHTFLHTQNLLFISMGSTIREAQIDWINEHLSGRAFELIYSNDLLGRMADLKTAAGIRRWPLAIYINDHLQVVVTFRAQNFFFGQENFSLSAFERASGVRFGIPARKPKQYNSFFEELKADAGLLT